MTINDLMKNVGCEAWPEKWEEYFEVALKSAEGEDFLYNKPEFYEQLEEKYQIIGEYLPVFKEAAEEVGKDKDLSLLLALLCEALKHRENIRKEIREYAHPKAPEGKSELGYNMLCGLAMYSMTDYTYKLLKDRNVPDDMIIKVLKKFAGGIDAYKIRNNGEWGYRNFGWNQIIVDGNIFPINRLNIEIRSNLNASACIFKNKKGDTVALADGEKLHKSGHVSGARNYENEDEAWIAELFEADSYWEGYPYGEDGLVKSEKIKLNKNEWEIAMPKGAPIVSLHISPGAKLAPEIVDETLRETKEFLNKYFPDYEYKGFTCSSWICNPNLGKLIGEDTNIAKFSRRFKPLASKSNGKSVFSFVFLKADDNFEIEDLPENTSLERALKKYYLDGNILYEFEGYFI